MFQWEIHLQMGPFSIAMLVYPRVFKQSFQGDIRFCPSLSHPFRRWMKVSGIKNSSSLWLVSGEYEGWNTTMKDADLYTSHKLTWLAGNWTIWRCILNTGILGILHWHLSLLEGTVYSMLVDTSPNNRCSAHMTKGLVFAHRFSP